MLILKKFRVVILSNNLALLNCYIITFASFAVPFIIGHNQIITGTIVNTCLFLASIYLPQPFLFSVILLPSLAVLAKGIIFGPLTPFIAILLPFIWASNWLLVYTFKKLLNISKNFVISGIIASTAKFAFLFLVIYLLSSIKILPKFFINTMAMLQLPTAIFGLILSYMAKKFIYDPIS